MRLGILGCRSIGTELALYAAKRPEIETTVLFDLDAARAEALAPKAGKAQA